MTSRRTADSLFRRKNAEEKTEGLKHESVVAETDNEEAAVSAPVGEAGWQVITATEPPRGVPVDVQVMVGGAPYVRRATRRPGPVATAFIGMTGGVVTPEPSAWRRAQD